MKNFIQMFVVLIILSAPAAFAQSNNQLVKDPWTKSQLMEPGQLAALLKDPKAKKPLIYNIGVVEDIPGALNMGGASEQANLIKFKKAISTLSKTTSIVVYCGCCPFTRCPNIRPAFLAMQQAGLKNGRLLNLSTNIKTDWISKGYHLKK